MRITDIDFNVDEVANPTPFNVIVYNYKSNGVTVSADNLSDDEYDVLTDLVFEMYNDGRI
tara:strand:+ start:566 stop:745 length:180 start_codon:yes stop_codon:yes gene_type:complete